MRNLIPIFLVLPFFAMAQEGRIGKVFELVTETKAKTGNFQTYEVFNTETEEAYNNYSTAVEDGVILELNSSKVAALIEENPLEMKLTLPIKSNSETVDLELVQVTIFSSDFRAVTNTGIDVTSQVDMGIHFRGVISGNSNSLVSISVFENQILGFISNNEGNYVIGKLENSVVDHIIYKDTDLKMIQEFKCATEDNSIGYTAEELTYPSDSKDPGDCVNVYIEAGQSVYNAFNGNLANTTAFLTGVFAQSYVLYANDGITLQTSDMFIWTTPDPYNFGTAGEYLDAFEAQTGTFNGDIGHLVEVQNIGGIAWVDGLCQSNSDFSLGFSGFAGTNFNNVPIYSFNVNIIAHEMGHLCGSQHTHACVWNGNNTAIDSCSGFTQGNCPLPGSPPEGGTIMSYCHVDPVGVNFSLGFGPQPTAVILNRIAAVNCLTTCGLIPPTAVCTNYTAQLDANGDVTIVPGDIDGGSFDDIAIVTFAIDIDTFDCNDVGNHNVVLTVTDGDGLSDSCTAVVTVEDNIAPVANCKNITVQLDATGNATILGNQLNDGSTDACGILTYSSNITSFDCSNVGNNPVVLTVTDDNGNSTTCNAVVTVEDSIAPVLICPADSTVEVSTGAQYELPDYFATGAASVIDNCTDPVTVITQSPAVGTLLSVGVHTILLTAEDEYGNQSICDFELTVEEILGVVNNELTSIVLYPNPTNNLVQLSNPQNLAMEALTIYDLTGRLIQSVDLRNMGVERSIDLSGLANASYMVLIQSVESQITKQLIKR